MVQKRNIHFNHNGYEIWSISHDLFFFSPSKIDTVTFVLRYCHKKNRIFVCSFIWNEKWGMRKSEREMHAQLRMEYNVSIYGGNK